MVPESFALVLATFAPCFTAPTYHTFRYLVAGWLQCAGRHTVTNVAVAAGVVGTADEASWRHISVFHRFFSRARWEPDALGKMVFTLALGLLAVGLPLMVLVDDSLTRK